MLNSNFRQAQKNDFEPRKRDVQIWRQILSSEEVCGRWRRWRRGRRPRRRRWADEKVVIEIGEMCRITFAKRSVRQVDDVAADIVVVDVVVQVEEVVKIMVDIVTVNDHFICCHLGRSKLSPFCLKSSTLFFQAHRTQIDTWNRSCFSCINLSFICAKIKKIDHVDSAKASWLQSAFVTHKHEMPDRLTPGKIKTNL